MMSVPPETIQVKRIKRTASDREEAEVEDAAQFDGPDYLRLPNPKRIHSDDFIYQRITHYSSTSATGAGWTQSRNVVPTIHPTKPGEENSSSVKPIILPESRPSTWQTIETRPIPQPASTTEPRRFHFSRPLLTPTSLLANYSRIDKRSCNTPTTVFVEQKHKKSRSEDVQMEDVQMKDMQMKDVQVKDMQMKDVQMKDVALGSPVAPEDPPRKLKRPGADRRGTPKPVGQIKKELHKPLDETHWAAENDDISRSMNDFALLIIEQNLAAEEERDKKAAAAAAWKQTGSGSHKFQPKPPAQRFADRHPDVISRQEALTPPVPDQEEYETANEDDYIVEIYVRVPASVLGQDVDPEKIGLLVFGNEADAEFFYGAEGDSDDEWAEDDEDENAENYYTADYPDEDLDSGDEHDRDAYNYRGNASDQEEFDERDEGTYVRNLSSNDNDGPMLPDVRMGLQPPSAFKR